MRVVEVIKKTIELAKCEKETLEAAIEILCGLYHNDEGNRIWHKIEDEVGEWHDISDFEDYAEIMRCLLELSNEDELSI